MLPHLNPASWLGLCDHLPRTPAAVFFAVCLSMLIFGVRGFRIYTALGGAAGAYVGGLALAKLMFVKPLAVAAPLAVGGGLVGFFFATPLLLLLTGFLGAVSVGLFLQHANMAGYYWIGFVGGGLAGVLLALFARRFAAAMLCATFGSAGAVASLGAVVNAPEGPFSPGGYAKYPLAFLLVGAVLFVVAIVLQSALDDPDRSRISVEGARS